MYVKEKPPLTFHIQAILISTQTMVDRSFSSPQKHRSPPPFAWTFIHVCAIRGNTDAVTSYAEVGSINAGVYRYSSPLTGFFFFPPWSCWDLDRRCAATGRRRRRAPPPPASRDRRWFPHFCFFSTCQCEERTYDFQYFHEQSINKNKWHMSISDTYSKCSKY